MEKGDATGLSTGFVGGDLGLGAAYILSTELGQALTGQGMAQKPNKEAMYTEISVEVAEYKGLGQPANQLFTQQE